ncbi:MAG: class I SAM-dependent methyltransferase [Spirochaetaceae bacterium]|nr:class I SAM-dependent methyltransferase [Spirochaetaceae bacterium]
MLEVGVGPGVLKAVLNAVSNCAYTSMDIRPELNPDYTGSVLDMPFLDNQYDIAVCFQVLEHLPYTSFEKALSELLRVAKKMVIISLPNAGRAIQVHIPKICRNRIFELPRIKKRAHVYNGVHYWEINQKGYDTRTIIDAITGTAKKYNYVLTKEYRVYGNPYHHFFVLTNTSTT